MFGHASILSSNTILIYNLAMFFCSYFVLIYCQYFDLTKKKLNLLLLQFAEILYVEQKNILKLNK